MRWFSELGRRPLMLLRRQQFDLDLQEEMRLHRALRESGQWSNREASHQGKGWHHPVDPSRHPHIERSALNCRPIMRKRLPMNQE
jgi:hypothetical protein